MWFPSEKAKSVADLTDVSVTTPKNHEVLMHNGTEWENSDVLKEYEVVESDNLLENHGITKTSNGITFTVYNDGTVDVDGTLTAEYAYIILSKYQEHGNLPMANGTYKLVGRPSSFTGDATFGVNLYNPDGSTSDNYDRGDGVTVDYVNGSDYNVSIIVSGGSGKTISHAIVKPMITKNLNATYADFVPFYKALKDSKLDIADEQILGAWNLLENKATTHVENGITFTVGNKKEVRVTTGSTAPSSATNCDIQRVTGNIFENLEVGKTYYLTGCPAGGSNSTYCMIMNHRDTASGTITYLNDTGNGLEFVYDGTWTSYQIAVQIWPAVGANFNKTFYPMISVKKDMPYVPYAPANKDCMSYAVNTKLGAHNLFKFNSAHYPGRSWVQNGVTVTINSDWSVTVNGTNTSNMGIAIGLLDGNTLKRYGNKRYILTGSPANVSWDSAYLYMHPGSSGGGWDPAVHDLGSGVYFTCDGQTTVFGGIQIKAGATVNNMTFKPMIRFAEDTDTTYKPYAMTNSELTEVKTLTPTATNTTSNATVTGISAVSVGKIVQYTLTIKTTAAVNVGESIKFTHTNLPLPVSQSVFAGYSSSTAAIAQMDVLGELVIRILGSNLPNDSYLNILGTYICK